MTIPPFDQPGQLLFVGFPGTRLPEELAARIAEGRIGGVVLFKRNLDTPAQARELVAALHAAAPPEAPLLVTVDQEGGRVQRLRSPWTEWPPMRRLGARNDPARTGAVARAIARELGDLGIGLDFAPVVDVDTNPENPVIGDRSFARTPEEVALHARHFILSMQAEGIAACAKHFPGHGDTAQDSHLELPRLDHDLERLRRIELPPFRAAIEARVASVMTAHVLVPRLDPERPATLSPDALALLRQELGFEGVVFSDDLEMRAVADRYSPAQRVLGALRAGVDVLLVCSDAAQWNEALRVLEAAPDALLERGLARLRVLKARYAGADARLAATSDGPPYEAHRRLAAELA